MESKDTQVLREKFPEYIDEVNKNYKRNFILTILDSSFFTFSLALFSIDAVIPYFISEIATNSSIWIGIITSLYTLGFTIPQLIGAYFVDVIESRKKVVLIVAILERLGLLLIAIVSLFIGKISNALLLATFIASFTIFAFTNGFISPAYSDLMSKNINKKRGLFFGLLNILSAIIGFLGSLTVKILLDRFNFPINIQYIFWISFISSFVSPFFIANFREVDFPIKRKKERFPVFIKKTFVSTLSNKPFVKFLIIRGLIGFSEMGHAFYAIYIVNKFQLPIGQLGYYSMIAMAAAGIFGMIWGLIGDRYGFKVVYICMILLFVFLNTCILLINQGWVLFLIAFLVGTVNSARSVADSNTMFEIAPPAETSNYVGINNTLLSPVYAIAPIIAGLLINRYSYNSLFQTVILLGFGSFVILVFFFKDPRKS